MNKQTIINIKGDYVEEKSMGTMIHNVETGGIGIQINDDLNNDPENEELDLCKLLKGHEGETFYSPICGECVFVGINMPSNDVASINFERGIIRISFYKSGQYYMGGECMVFPSKDQHDWNVWARKKKYPQKQWISVKDMLPDAYANVLITSNGSIEIGFHEGGQFYRNTEYAVEKNGKIKGTFLFTPRIFNVTHWMQLPELPTI